MHLKPLVGLVTWGQVICRTERTIFQQMIWRLESQLFLSFDVYPKDDLFIFIYLFPIY
jgi:hypothetical protein